jgi:adenylate cyclase
VGEPRKLAAILVADVVGYSRLARADEGRTLARLRGLRSYLIDPAIAAHHGRIAKRTDDGSIVKFPSVVDAVRCAIEVQNGLIERDFGAPPERRIEFRVGIHVGDVVEESDGDLMGDGVNVAARLAGIANPGAICLSEDAYRQVRQQLDLKVSDRGPTHLTNIAQPVSVYSLEVGQAIKSKRLQSATPADAVRALASNRRLSSLALAYAIAALFLLAAAGGLSIFGGRLTKPAQAARLSVVVLPFRNLSGDPSQDYFADGVTENLTTELSRIRESLVIARNTAFTYKGKSVDAKEIGKELRVRYLLEGSAQRDKDRVRVNAELVDAESGARIWADRFDEDVADLFKLQDEVVTRLARSLDVALVKAEAEKGARSKNPEAVDLTMRGADLIRRGLQLAPTERRKSIHEARALFERALQIDPNYAEALAGSAETYFDDYFNGWAEPGTDYEAKVLGQANRAITLAPNSVEGYYQKAQYLSLSRRFEEALGVASAGLAVDPNFVPLLDLRAGAENSLGRYEQAIADAQQAMRLSPLDPATGAFQVIVGDAEIGLGHFEVAIDEIHRAIRSDFRTYFVYADLAAAYALAGRMDEAKAALAQASRLEPALTIKFTTQFVPPIPNLLEGLRKAGLPEE